MKIQLTLSAVCAAIVLFFVPSFAAAQTDCSNIPHSHVQTVATMCLASGAEFSCNCVCDRGYSPRDGGSPSATNPCVRDDPSWGSYADPLCAFGAERGADGQCMCPESLGARRSRSLVIVDREFAESIRDQIEDYEDLRRHGRVVALQACIDPLASAGSNGSVSSLLQQAVDALRSDVDALRGDMETVCGAEPGATPEARREACVQMRSQFEQLLDLLNGGGDPADTNFQDRVTNAIGEIREDLSALDGRVTALEDQVGDHDRRISDLERGWHAFLDATHLRLGGFGRLGFSSAGEATGAGGAAVELLFRFGSAPVGLFLRGEFGGQETGLGVGNSMYLAGGAGLAFFTGGRRDTTIGLGFFAEDLLEPFADGPNEVQGSHLGVVAGGELSASIPLPGDAYWVRIRPGFALGYTERYFIAENNAFSVSSGVYVAPSLAIEFQPDFR